MNLQHTYTGFPIISGDEIRTDSMPGETLLQPEDKWCKCDNTVEKNEIRISEENGLTMVSAEIRIKVISFLETMTFCTDRPSVVEVSVGEPVKRVVAYYLFRDWWTRPAFVEDLTEIPTRSELLLIETESGCIAVHAALNRCGHIQFAPSSDASSIRMHVCFTETGRSFFEGPLCYAFEAKDGQSALRGLMEKLASVYGIPTREGRKYPEDLRGLGWCSWDAFYRDVTGEKLLQKCAEAEEKKIPFRWMIIDDGWQSVDEEERMTDYREDPVKFPEGLKSCVEEMKRRTGVQTVGVWHSFAGYWSGTRKDSPLFIEKKGDLVENGRGQWIPAPEKEKAFDYYGTWHRYLKQSGIDLLKVDSQSTLATHYRGTAPLSKAAGELHQALDASAALWMNGNLINCMGMAKENVFSRPMSAISRNSDDFYPRLDGSFEEHLLQNAYNALYHSVLYYTDWDMFWTSHPQAEKHALIRALSAGPVYVSDQVGDSRREVLMKLCYEDGTVLRADRPAIPTADCVFADPEKTGYLKLKNECGGISYLAAYSYHKGDREISFTVKDLAYDNGCSPDAEEYVIFDVFGEKGQRVSADETVSVKLPDGDFRFLAAAPLRDGAAVFGRSDKHLMSHALESISRTENELTVVLKEAGEFLFYAESEPVSVTSEGRACPIVWAKDGFYKAAVSGRTVQICLR